MNVLRVTRYNQIKMSHYFLIAGTVFGFSGLAYLSSRSLHRLKDFQPPSSLGKSFLKRGWGKITGFFKSLFGGFEWEVIAQKILSWVKVVALRVERRASKSLVNLRKRIKRKKESEKYWKHLAQLSKKEEEE